MRSPELFLWQLLVFCLPTGRGKSLLVVGTALLPIVL